MQIGGNVVLVTGGAGVLGSATCRHLAGLGATVVVADLDAKRAEAVAADLPRARGTSIDVTDDASVDSVLDIAAELGGVRAVIGCAGTGHPVRILAKDGAIHPTAFFREMLETHAVGSFVVMARAAARMAQLEPLEGGERGVVINTSSLAGLEGSSGLLAYGSAKAAVAGMTLIAARDLSPVAVRVMAIAPSNVIAAERQEEALANPSYQRLLAQAAWPPRFGYPQEYVDTVEFILRNQFINGSVIRLDGGARLPLK